MLITKSEDIYKPKKIRFIIEALARRRIPTITTSRPLLKSGSAVSITSNEDEAIGIIADLANQLRENPNTTDAFKSETKSITVNTNRHMMRLFNLNIKEGIYK